MDLARKIIDGTILILLVIWLLTNSAGFAEDVTAAAKAYATSVGALRPNPFTGR